MPHPGLKVTNRKDFDGRLSGKNKKQKPEWIDQSFLFYVDIEPDFKAQLLSFVPALFRSDNSNFIKEINGEQISSTDLFEYFRVHIEYFTINLF